ncbi:putative small GTPase superfamily, ARF/SAR type, P-loop containing nucleoside triphosphate hydrolase [Helianthus debilis subsp. tardiflorus]
MAFNNYGVYNSVSIHLVRTLHLISLVFRIIKKHVDLFRSSKILLYLSKITAFTWPYWRCYFPNTQAIIYVVDSSDTERLVIAKEEFHAILEEEELKGAVVLIFANKQDLPGALDDAAVTESLELHKIKNRQWSIFKTSAIKGEGLFEGLDWYAHILLYISHLLYTHILVIVI